MLWRNVVRLQMLTVKILGAFPLHGAFFTVAFFPSAFYNGAFYTSAFYTGAFYKGAFSEIHRDFFLEFGLWRSKTLTKWKEIAMYYTPKEKPHLVLQFSLSKLVKIRPIYRSLSPKTSK